MTIRSLIATFELAVYEYDDNGDEEYVVESNNKIDIVIAPVVQ